MAPRRLPPHPWKPGILCKVVSPFTSDDSVPFHPGHEPFQALAQAGFEKLAKQPTGTPTIWIPLGTLVLYLKPEYYSETNHRQVVFQVLWGDDKIGWIFAEYLLPVSEENSVFPFYHYEGTWPDQVVFVSNTNS